jgi:hypothetical protein
MKRLSPAIFAVCFLIPWVASCSNSPATVASASPPTVSTAPAANATNSAAPEDERDAIAMTIQTHLRENKGINTSAMEMTIGKVTVNGEEAQADTEFRLRQGGTSMLITYFLERHGSGWLVVRNQPSGAGQFAHPPMDKIHSGDAVGGRGATFPDLSQYRKQ